MSKNKRRHNQARSKTVQTSSYELHNIKTSMYHGAARFLEIAPPGIQFRSMTNIDHITAITFGNHYEEIKDVGEAGATIEKQLTGYDITVGIAGQQNAFTFHRLEVAIAYYNDLLNMLAALGVPCAMKPRIQFVPPPVEEEKDDPTGGYEIVGADGKPLANLTDDERAGLAELADDPLIDELNELSDELLEDEPLEDDAGVDDEAPTEH